MVQLQKIFSLPPSLISVLSFPVAYWCLTIKCFILTIFQEDIHCNEGTGKPTSINISNCFKMLFSLENLVITHLKLEFECYLQTNCRKGNII